MNKIMQLSRKSDFWRLWQKNPSPELLKVMLHRSNYCTVTVHSKKIVL